uniref:J domain-containing protein n=1 Tax=Solanum lycopersicum TaxID=4081 RepID=A0A3Q7JHQ6_SOLLC
MEHPFFINNGPPTNRSEALRFLSIAEKLLTNRDLVGSKSFATRARDADPTFAPATDQILGIVDTLNAGDKRINNHHFDYYSILQIPHNQTQNVDFIAEQYRRFALLLNPQNNSFPFSDQAFRLVVDAFSVLSNPMRKSMYDKELGFFLNLYPVAASTAPTSNFVHQNVYQSMPSSNADQMFVNLPSQDAAGVSFSRDPQAGISMPPTFLTREQETVTSMGSSDIGQQQQQPQQPVTFLRQQTQPVTSISFSNTDEKPATFLSLNQPQPVTSVRSLTRENPPVGVRLSSTQGREPVVTVEQHGNQQLPERNENVVGNNANKSASTSDDVKEQEGNVDGSGNNDDNLQDGLATQGGVEISHAVTVESSNRGVTSKTRRQRGRVAKHFGNLDLNVEFSNEVEEPIIQMSRENEAGEGEDDTVEVIGADDRFLSYDEMEIVEIVPDLVSVVLSHATILEEFQTMREKLEMKNRQIECYEIKPDMDFVSEGDALNFGDEKASSDQKIIVNPRVKNENRHCSLRTLIVLVLQQAKD